MRLRHTLLAVLNEAATFPSVSLGHHAGLFIALADVSPNDPHTAASLAAAASGIHVRPRELVAVRQDGLQHLRAGASGAAQPETASAKGAGYLPRRTWTSTA